MGSPVVALYYIIVVLVGAFIILNLFLELLLSGFNAGEPPEFSISSFLSLFGIKIFAPKVIGWGVL